jgi:hypothetical protein
MTSKDEPIQPWSGKAGEPFRAYRNRLRLHLGTKTDKSGSSMTNYLDGDDMGGPLPTAPALPGGHQDAELSRLRRGRANIAYATICSTIAAPDIQLNLMNTYSANNAYDMWQHLQNMYDTPLDVSQSDDYITQIFLLSIAEHIGFDEDTVHKFADKPTLFNNKLDIADRLNHTNVGNRILLAIMASSSHLHIEARTELKAPLPQRRFKIPPINAQGNPNPMAGHSDLQRLIHHFDNAWRDLIKSGYNSKRGPSRRVATAAAAAATATDIAMHVAFVADGCDGDDSAVTLVDALNITTSEII